VTRIKLLLFLVLLIVACGPVVTAEGETETVDAGYEERCIDGVVYLLFEHNYTKDIAVIVKHEMNDPFDGVEIATC
jgi:hypothetical protein